MQTEATEVICFRACLSLVAHIDIVSVSAVMGYVQPGENDVEPVDNDVQPDEGDRLGRTDLRKAIPGLLRLIGFRLRLRLPLPLPLPLRGSTRYPLPPPP
jgi:hypothetical protein